MKFFISLMTLFFSTSLLAGVAAYSGTAGQKLFVEDGGKDTFFVKFTGLKSPWENKVIKTTRTGRQDGYRYAFDYQYELSSGIQHKTYSLLVDARPTLVSGSIVPQVTL